MTRGPRFDRARALLGAALVSLLASCGLAESVVEEFVDDQDYELYAGTSTIGTLVREPGGVDVALQEGVLLPGDRDSDDQALGLLGFPYDRSLQPDKTRLEWIQLWFWVEPGEGDVEPLGPLIVSHIPNAEDLLGGTGVVPNPPGNDVGTVTNTAARGWRQVDVSSQFLADWNAGRSLSGFAIRFPTPTDEDGEDDFVDLFPEVDGTLMRAHLVLHFGVDL